MKVLVYGAGVIGSYLAHVLLEAGQKVTLLARHDWAENLRKNGMIIRHHLQRKTTVDWPEIIEAIDPAVRYDAVFAVMPCTKMALILDDLAAVGSEIVVLVGNNTAPDAMRAEILHKTQGRKLVLFGFQATAGNKVWEEGVGKLVCERAGTGTMDIGRLDRPASPELRHRMEHLFRGSGYKLRWQDSMRDYLVCHAAAVLPLCYAAYAALGDFTKTTPHMRELCMKAPLEGYGLLVKLGHHIVPENDDAYFRGGPGAAVMRLLYFLMAKTEMGDLIAAAHCRHAVDEMEELDRNFEELRASCPDYAMPAWEELRNMMPSWEECRERRARALAAAGNEREAFAAPLD